MALQNNTKRFDELIWPHMATVLRTAEVLSHNAAAAEDLTQDTMVKAFKSLDGLRNDACAKAWLMTILRRLHVDRARSSRNVEQSLEGMNLDPAAPIVEGRMDGEAAWDEPAEILETFSNRQIIAALKELPKEIRWTLLLVDVEGLDQHDAAEILEIPVGTIKSRIHRGRDMLRAALMPVAQLAAQHTQISVAV